MGGYDWNAFTSNVGVYSYLLNLISDTFGLEHQPIWWEALRERFFSLVPLRLALFEAGRWKEVEAAFENEKAGDAEMYRAAWELIYDGWRYSTYYHDHPDEVIKPEGTDVSRLVELTRNNEAPPLRIAHCLRDMGYGNSKREKDLEALMESDDPAYREIFEACYWVEPKKKRGGGRKRST
jgi:hypothetical protein